MSAILIVYAAIFPNKQGHTYLETTYTPHRNADV